MASSWIQVSNSFYMQKRKEKEEVFLGPRGMEPGVPVVRKGQHRCCPHLSRLLSNWTAHISF